jgi:hypothetical protein
MLDNTGKQWVKQRTLQLFNISWDLWEHCNSIKYKTIHPAKQREILQLDERIQAEYGLGDKDLLARDK